MLDTLARPRTLAVLLAVSLGINLFLAGGVAGRLSARHHDGPPPLPLLGLGGPGMESGFRFIPREGREHMRDVLHERRPELRAEHKALRELHRAIATELAKATPDRALIEGKFGEIRGKTLKIEESMQAAFLDAALAMDPAARQRMLEAMRERRGHAPHHGPPGAGRGESGDFEAPLPPPGMAPGMPFTVPLPPPEDTAPPPAGN